MADQTNAKSRSIRIFVASTYRDMEEERDDLMTHAWPELRRFCRPSFAGLLGVRCGWTPESRRFRHTTIQQIQPEVLAHE